MESPAVLIHLKMFKLFTHTLTDHTRLTHSLTHSLARSVAHSLTHSITHSRTHSLTQSLGLPSPIMSAGAPKGLQARKHANQTERANYKTTNYLKGPCLKILGSCAARKGALVDEAVHARPFVRLRVQRRDHQRRDHHPQTKRIQN